ncbi:MAG: transposase [Chloroflexi bacterium]|nr:transposase [Chloroflexota bacterium]
MNLIAVFQRFPDHESCIEHLEAVRWGEIPACPLCGCVTVGRKADGDRVGRWNCHECKSSFNVLSGTIFEKTKIPLQKWFLGIAIILNAKKSVSSHQLSRDLDLNQKSAWYMMMRIREAIVDDGALLSGIVGADKAYIRGEVDA